MDFVSEILALVEKILAYFGEVDAAGVLDIIKEFFAGFAA